MALELKKVKSDSKRNKGSAKKQEQISFTGIKLRCLTTCEKKIPQEENKSKREKQVAYLDAHPEVGLLGTWVEIIGERGERLSVLRRPVDSLFMTWSLLFDNCLVHSTVMYRRSLVGKLGGYNPVRYAQDYDLWSCMSFQTQVAKLPEVLVSWRRHPAGITVQKLARQ